MQHVSLNPSLHTDFVGKLTSNNGLPDGLSYHLLFAELYSNEGSVYQWNYIFSVKNSL